MSIKAEDTKQKLETTKTLQALQTPLNDAATPLPVTVTASTPTYSSSSSSAPVASVDSLVPLPIPGSVLIAGSGSQISAGLVPITTVNSLKSQTGANPISEPKEYLEKIERLRLFAFEIGADPEQFVKEQLALERAKLDEEDRAVNATGAIANSDPSVPAIQPTVVKSAGTVIEPDKKKTDDDQLSKDKKDKKDNKDKEEKFHKEASNNEVAV